MFKDFGWLTNGHKEDWACSLDALGGKPRAVSEVTNSENLS